MTASTPRKATTSAAIAAPIGADSHAVARIRSAKAMKNTPKSAVTILLKFTFGLDLHQASGERFAKS